MIKIIPEENFCDSRSLQIFIRVYRFVRTYYENENYLFFALSKSNQHEINLAARKSKQAARNPIRHYRRLTLRRRKSTFSFLGVIFYRRFGCLRLLCCIK